MGLSLQHYTSNGEIIVGGIVALSADKSRVLIIRSVRRNGWVLPKGRWRSPEKTPAEIAIRRAWDEAGLIVTVERYLGVVNQTTEATRPSSQETDSYCFYEMNVESQSNSFPQSKLRTPSWVSYQTARKAFYDRPEFVVALDRSSIRKIVG
jgi:diphosphoinositol-polyphosphate diphosphatase